MSEPRHRRKPPASGKQRILLEEDSLGLRRRGLLMEREVVVRRRRKIGWSVVLALVLLGAAVGYSLIANRDSTTPTSTIPFPTEQGAAAVMAVVSDEGTVVSVAIAVGHPTLPDYLILFPPGLISPIPAFGDRDLADALPFGGAELVGLTVSNLIGIRVDAVSVIEPDELMALLPTTLEVDSPVALMIEQSGVTEVVEPAGKSQMTPDRVVRLLYEQGTEDQLAWLQRQGAVWRSLLSWLGQDQTRIQSIARDDGNADALAAALASVATDTDLVLTGLEVSRVVAAGSADFYRLSNQVAENFVDDKVPFLRLREGIRPRVEILNGRGQVVGATQPIAAQLVRSGFRVVRTDNAERVVAETQVIAQGFDNQEVAKEIHGMLERGSVILEARQPSTVVDITIILGQDFAA